MSMYTRCSSCNTRFRVTVQQLQACSGQVRCGRCTNVFDAFATLTARPPGDGEDPPALENSVREPQRAPVAPSVVPSVPTTVVPSFTRPPEEALALMSGASEQVSLSTTLTMPTGSAAEPLTLPADLFSRAKGPKLPGPTWLWSSAAGLLGVFALLQFVLLFRSELAASMPSTRGALQALCAPLSCEVPLPRYPDSLYIESSDLQMVDSARPQEVLLTATIRNRADKLQAYPMLELTLTDTMDQPIAKKHFHPKEYLPAHLSETVGFAPGSEVGVRLMLYTSELRASGYRLFLYFPS